MCTWTYYIYIPNELLWFREITFCLVLGQDINALPYSTENHIQHHGQNRFVSFWATAVSWMIFFPPLKHTDTRLSLNYRRNCYKTSWILRSYFKMRKKCTKSQNIGNIKYFCMFKKLLFLIYKDIGPVIHII